VFVHYFIYGVCDAITAILFCGIRPLCIFKCFWYYTFLIQDKMLYTVNKSIASWWPVCFFFLKYCFLYFQVSFSSLASWLMGSKGWEIMENWEFSPDMDVLSVAISNFMSFILLSMRRRNRVCLLNFYFCFLYVFRRCFVVYFSLLLCIVALSPTYNPTGCMFILLV
jgi:hypothetical protein